MLYTNITTEEFLEIRTKEAIETGLEQGRKQGLEQGRKQGLEQGLEQGKMEMQCNIAKNMKNKGFSAGDIAEMTGLEECEIESL